MSKIHFGIKVWASEEDIRYALEHDGGFGYTIKISSRKSSIGCGDAKKPKLISFMVPLDNPPKRYTRKRGIISEPLSDTKAPFSG